MSVFESFVFVRCILYKIFAMFYWFLRLFPKNKTTMNIEIINIGDELLIGQVVNTNCSFMAKELNNIGINVKYITVINDDEKEIEKSIILALQRADGVLITGGLGPTKDDMTKHCLNAMFGGTLVENKSVSDHVRCFFEARNLPYTSTNHSQAMVPDCCEIIFNHFGTAPGMVFKSKELFEGKPKLVISLPGVPFEMQEMFNDVKQILIDHYRPQTIIHKSIILSGISESFLSDKLLNFENHLADLNKQNPERCFSLAYLPDAGMMKLRLSLHGGQRAIEETEFEQVYSMLRKETSAYFVCEEDKNIAQIIGQILTAKNQTLASAESCTGGNIAHTITLNSGASEYFKGGVVAYCNEIKNKILGVKQDVLDNFGAVSEQTAKQMAQGVLKLYDTDFAIATTGLAGPNGDGSDNEVGTVYIAIATKNGETIVKNTCYKTSRSNFIDRVTTFALSELLAILR